MNKDAFVAAYDALRDDVPLRYHLHCSIPKFGYSGGVHALARTGCFSLVDYIGRECAPALSETDHFFAHIFVHVRDHEATVAMIPSGTESPMLLKHIAFSGLPDGDWKFCLINEGDRTTLVLPTEH